MTIVSYFLQLSLLLLFPSAVHPVANADDDDNDEYANGNGRNGSVNGVWIDSVIVVAVSIFDVPFDEYLQNAWMFECEVVIIDLFLSEKSEILWNSGGNGAMQRCFFEGF